MYSLKNIFHYILLITTILLASCSDSRDTDKVENIITPGSLKQDLISRVNDFPKELLLGEEKKRIITMLSEVDSISLIADVSDMGGQIYGPGRRHLKIGKKLLEDNNFHMERNLVRVLYHESRHWEDLKQSKFSLLLTSSGNNESDAFISKMALLELYAYQDDYKLAERFNQANPKYLMPECAEYLPDGTLKFRAVTADIFGFGRSLMSNYTAIDSMNWLTTKEKQERFYRFTSYYKNNFSETAPFKKIQPIDCKYKHGF